MARSLNKCLFIGNLTKDPEVREVGTTSVAKFSMALNKTWKDKSSGEYKNSVEYADFELWGVAATIFGDRASKGSQVFVEGEFTQQTWEDKDGNPRKSVVFKVMPNSWEVFGKRSASSENEGSSSSQTQNQQTVEDEIPF